MFKKIKVWLFGEDQFGDKVKQLMKNKKMGTLHKIDKLHEYYRDFVLDEFIPQVMMATYEMHYEEFMIDGKKHQHRFELLFQYEYDMAANINVRTYYNAVKTLLEKVEPNMLREEDIEIIKKTSKLEEKHKISEILFEDYFVGFELMRDEKSKAIQEYFDDLAQIFEKERKIKKEIEENFTA